MNTTAKLQGAFLAGVAGIVAGCGPSLEPTLAGDSPQVSLLEPKNRARFKPGELIRFFGEVDARQSNGSLGMVIIEIARDKQWSDSFDSYATPVRTAETGTYSFEALRTAPSQSGTYYARARSNISERTGQPVSHRANSKMRISSQFIEIEVTR